MSAVSTAKPVRSEKPDLAQIVLNTIRHPVIYVNPEGFVAYANADAEAFFAAIATPEVKAQLKANTDEVIARGGFGSPTFFVDGDDMYFGNDRLVLVRDAVLRRRALAR